MLKHKAQEPFTSSLRWQAEAFSPATNLATTPVVNPNPNNTLPYTRLLHHEPVAPHVMATGHNTNATILRKRIRANGQLISDENKEALSYPQDPHDQLEYMSLDVECAATGRGHDDLSPCRISLVNSRYEVLLDIIINTENLVSPLTPLTGLTKEDLRQGIPLKEGLQRLHAILHNRVVLVGQLIDQDCIWCRLVQGQHYRHLIDLSECLKLWKPKIHRYLYFSLDRAAFGLLGIVSDYPHCPIRDATMSMRIYNEYVKNDQLEIAKAILRNALNLKLFPKRTKPELDVNVCIGKFNSRLCTCHQTATCYR